MRFPRGEEGQTELVIVFPVAMLLVLILLQAALWFLGRSVAQDAAQDGARAAALLGGGPGAGAQAARDDLVQLAGPMLSSTSVSVTETAGRAQVRYREWRNRSFPDFPLR